MGAGVCHSGEVLEGLCRVALEQGADNAVVLPASEVIVDPRVRLKCMIPKCYMSGDCSHCPPHGYSTDETRRMVLRYEWGVFFRVRVKSSIIAAKALEDSVNSGVVDDHGNAFNLGGYYMLVLTIVKVLQKRARGQGCTDTLGFAAGSCRDPFCFLEATCQELMTDRGCRNPHLSSPSMESSGLDAFTMAARVGWDVFPIGGTCEPDSVSHGSLMGLVLIA